MDFGNKGAAPSNASSIHLGGYDVSCVIDLLLSQIAMTIGQLNVLENETP